MLSGVLTQDSLTQALRTLSQKRRHGILEISAMSHQIEIAFQNGKIIETKFAESPLVDAVCDKLMSAEKISPRERDALVEAGLEMQSLYEQLVDAELVTEDEFLRAKHSVEKDILYSLRDADSGFFQFKSKIVTADPKLCMSLSPGQLLLDMMELDASEKRFKEKFGGVDSVDIGVKRLSPSCGDGSLDERRVWDSVDSVRCIQKIYDFTLLSTFELQEALLALYDKHLIDITHCEAKTNGHVKSANGAREEGVQSKSLRGKLVSDEELDSIDALIDEAADMLSTVGPQEDSGDADEALHDSMLEEAELPTTVNSSSLGDNQYGGPGDMSSAVYSVDEDARDELYEEPGAEPELDSEEEADRGVRRLVEGDVDSKSPRLGVASSMYRMPFEANVFFFQDRVIELCLVCVILAFCAILSWLFPAMLQTWFDAIRALVSAKGGGI